MSAFLDASVIVAILAREIDGDILRERLNAYRYKILVSPFVLYEATISLARNKAGVGAPVSPSMIAEARRAVLGLVADANADIISIDRGIADRAIEASMRFGKIVRHPAGLNLGDCFAYACASSESAALFFKGADFTKTDIPAA